MGRKRSPSIEIADLDEGRRALVIGSAAAATAFLMAEVAGLPPIPWPSLPTAATPAARAGRRKLFQAVALAEGFAANGSGQRAAVHYITADGQVRGATGLDPRRLAAVSAEADVRSLILRLPRPHAPAAIERAALERIGERPVAEALVVAGVVVDVERSFRPGRPSYRLYDLAATLAVVRDFAPDPPAIGPAMTALLATVDRNGVRDAALAARVAVWRDATSPWHRKRRQSLTRSGAIRWSITDFDGKTRLDYAITPVV